MVRRKNENAKAILFVCYVFFSQTTKRSCSTPTVNSSTSSMIWSAGVGCTLKATITFTIYYFMNVFLKLLKIPHVCLFVCFFPDQVELMDRKGTVVKLEGREFSLDRASALLKNRHKYILVQVCSKSQLYITKRNVSKVFSKVSDLHKMGSSFVLMELPSIAY